MHAEETELEILSGESQKADKDFKESKDEPDSLCMILAETKLRYQDREIHTDPSSGAYNSDSDDASGGEELELIALSRKSFRQLSCKSIITTNLEPKSNGGILSKIVCIEIQDDIHKQMGHQGIDKVQQRKLHRFDREEGLRELDQCMLVKMTQEK